MTQEYLFTPTIVTKVSAEKKKSEALLSLIATYRTEILGDRTSDSLKKTYLASYKDDCLGKMTVMLAEMFENGSEFGEMVTKLDGFV